MNKKALILLLLSTEVTIEMKAVILEVLIILLIAHLLIIGAITVEKLHPYY